MVSENEQYCGRAGLKDTLALISARHCELHLPVDLTVIFISNFEAKANRFFSVYFYQYWAH